MVNVGNNKDCVDNCKGKLIIMDNILPQTRNVGNGTLLQRNIIWYKRGENNFGLHTQTETNLVC